MKCAIMQPSYIPWAGYFNLMSQVDFFVFLDDVQFARRSWQQRNRILLGGKEKFLTIPVSSKGKRDHLIYEVEIDDSQDWRRKHITTILHAYAKHQYKEEVAKIIRTVDNTQYTKLVDLNIILIKDIAIQLELSCSFIRASELMVSGKRSKHLLGICEQLGCDEYLSPVGSSQYLEEDGIFENSQVRLNIQDYRVLPYEQVGSENFVSHLSIIDILAHIGWEKSREYVRN